MGYHRAGFEVVGVDIKPQPRYPFQFIQADALEFLTKIPPGFDAIHASPPCQKFTAYRRRSAEIGSNYPDLIADTRTLLEHIGLPWIIENIPKSPLINPVNLCGSSFGLDIRRHRLFESNIKLVTPPCHHDWQTPRFPPATNRTNLRSTVEVGAGRCSQIAKGAMGVYWMTKKELSEAIPPIYTEYLGRQLRATILASRGLPAIAP